MVTKTENPFKKGDEITLGVKYAHSPEKLGAIANRMSCDTAAIIGETFKVCRTEGSQVILDVRNNKDGRLHQIGVAAKFFTHANPP